MSKYIISCNLTPIYSNSVLKWGSETSYNSLCVCSSVAVTFKKMFPRKNADPHNPAPDILFTFKNIIFSFVLWDFHTMHSVLTAPSSRIHAPFCTAPQVLVLFVFITSWVYFMLTMYCWFCHHLLEHSQPTEGHLLRENWHLLHQKPAAVTTPRLW